MKFKSLLNLNLISILGFSLMVSCKISKNSTNLENYENNENIKENIYKIDNNLWNSFDFNKRNNAFLIQDQEVFKQKIISEILPKNIMDNINSNWNNFYNQFNMVFNENIQKKFHIIYYSSYSSREPIYSVEIKNNNVKIHYSTYDDKHKSLIEGQYLIFIEKNKLDSVNSITFNDIYEDNKTNQYSDIFKKRKNKIWFS
ncbi:hypothetical protein [Mycoplasmopsis felis]|uniref:hypothetical protein n=1 Tax=Mycoplasmopsis felis TaxID=33923 RepID=UPI002AFEA211|nr:hypothetical protein [Mycoplasmopsis felis]WQQ08420.1 hypothetical protein RRG61_03820 [Mycoplasmopsis felis]